MELDIVTTVLVAATAEAPAGPYDLTDLATAKDELSLATGDTSKDSWISRAITQVSTAIASHCNRVFAIETVQDTVYPPRDFYPYQVPGGVGALQLSRWPVLAPPLVLAASATVGSGAVLSFANTAGVAPGQPASHPSIPATATVQSVTSTTVTLTQPLSGTVTAGDSVTFGLSVTVTDPPGTAKQLVAGTDFQILAETGQLVRLSPFTAYPMHWDPVLTAVAYQAGYASIPDDLVDATLREVTKRFAGRGRDPLLRSQDQPGAGSRTYWIGTVPGVRGAFTEEIRGLIDKYRVPVVR